jgi:amino acid transporter
VSSTRHTQQTQPLTHPTGEIEFWLSFSKIIVLTGLIILGIILDLGGGPTGDRIGFRYWNGLDRAFNQYKVPGALGRFLGVWSVMTLSLFAYMGSELVGVCVGETANPRKAIPSAIKKTFFRILVFYIIGSTLCGMLVPRDDPRLVGSAGAKKGTAGSSPFVIAIVRAQIPILPSLVNACLLLFTLSASNSDLYIGARTLYGLAADGKAPKIFLNCNKRGVPYVCLALCSVFCGLAYMSASTGGAQAFGYLTSTVSIFGGLTWCSILFSHIRFMKACKVEGIDRNDLPYKSPAGPYGSWFALILTMIVLFFKGFASFIGPRFDYRSFITHYIGLPVFALLYIVSKIMWKSKLVKLDEMNLRERARTFDDLNIKEDEEDQPRNMKEKVAHWAKNW